MSNALLKIYHYLPSPTRSIAATLRGYYLRQWRYGPETEQLIEQAIEREGWSPKQWKQWQDERLAFVLYRAINHVPYYREYWSSRRRQGDYTSWEILDNWPVLQKSQLRKSPDAFVADDCDKRNMFRDSTSGTTGTPLSIYLTKETLRQWYAMFEARLRRWHDVSLKENWAILGGQLVIPVAQTRPPFGVFNAALNQLYLSTHHISAENAKWYVEALHRYNVTHMIVYPSSANVLADAILEQSLALPNLKVIFSNAEALFDQQRETIAKAFQCPVINTYGMGEYVLGASECREGRMHLWPEVGVLEVFKDFEDLPTQIDEVGRFVATSLLNADMPLIRYETGDRGKLVHSTTRCSCNRYLPVVATIEGRMNDLIITADGRRIFWLNPVFYGLPILEAQIIQETLDCIRVRYVPDANFSAAASESIQDRLQVRLGKVNIILEEVPRVPREVNGKFRAVICSLSPEQREMIGRKKY